MTTGIEEGKSQNIWKTEITGTRPYATNEFEIEAKRHSSNSGQVGQGIKKLREPDSIEDTLGQRETTYGDFMSLANIAQNLKDGLKVGNWRSLSNDKKEALEMLMTKVARILNGDSENFDSWTDCIGYLTLVKMRLGENE